MDCRYYPGGPYRPWSIINRQRLRCRRHCDMSSSSANFTDEVEAVARRGIECSNGSEWRGLLDVTSSQRYFFY